jgi:two-component system chemotaxis response regulator CheY
MARRIVVVNGSAEARQVQSFVLSSAGFEILEAAGGGEALARLAGPRVHLVVTDQRLPDQDGLQDGLALVRAIREDAAHRFTPVVVITPEPEGHTVRAAREAGATGWLARPFTPDQLLAVVHRLVGARP